MTQARILDGLERCREHPPAIQCELVAELRWLGRRLGRVSA